MLCVCARLAMAQILYSIGVSGGQESMTLALKYFAKAASQSQIIKIKTAQHLDSRCVLLSDPSTFGAGGPNQNTSRIKIL